MQSTRNYYLFSLTLSSYCDNVGMTDHAVVSCILHSYLFFLALSHPYVVSFLFLASLPDPHILIDFANFYITCYHYSYNTFFYGKKILLLLMSFYNHYNAHFSSNINYGVFLQNRCCSSYSFLLCSLTG